MAKNIEHLDAVDAHSLKDALTSFERESGFAITIHDIRGFITDNDKIHFISSSHKHRYCEIGRIPGGEWDARCLRCCLKEVHETAFKDLRPFLHHCWKGVSEIIVPVSQNGVLLMILYAGVFKAQEDELSKELKRHLEPDYEKLPLLTRRRIEDLKNVISLLGQGILSYALAARQEPEPSSRNAIVRKYLFEHAHSDASLKGLAECLALSVSRTRHLVHENFKSSFNEMLLNERMTRSRNLLLANDTSLKEIAEAVGIPNVYYFNRCFKQYFGMPPGEFRRRNALPSNR